jgi:hypothetical protein
MVAGRVGLSELAMFVALLGGPQAFGARPGVGPVVFATADSLDALREQLISNERCPSARSSAVGKASLRAYRPYCGPTRRVGRGFA